MIRIRQKFDTTCLEDPIKATRDQLRSVDVSEIIKPGDRVGIAVGSRGIRDLRKILGVVVKTVSAFEAHPFFIPAMGSHGNASAENQARIVAEMVGDELSSIPVVSRMDVRELGETVSGTPVYFSSDALEMDKVILVNRIKPHTDFSGKIESGLLKMLTVGLGKHKGAEACHIAARIIGMERVIREVAAGILPRSPVVLGVGIVENAYDRTARIAVLTPGRFGEAEEVLMAEARGLMPRLPFDEIDILIVDEIGKDISGNGMDTNIVGRFGEVDETWPKIDRIFVRDLTDVTQGNAIGIGLADVTTTRLIKKIDMEATKINCLTSLSSELGRIPFGFENDHEALTTLARMRGVDADHLRVLWIRNTLDLEKCLVSIAYRDGIRVREDLELLDHESPLQFDHELNLINPLTLNVPP